MALCVTCVFAITLAVFPVITVRVRTAYKDVVAWGESRSGSRPPATRGRGQQPCLSPPPDRVFTCVCCFIVFNVMDLVGRIVVSLVQWVSPLPPPSPGASCSRPSPGGGVSPQPPRDGVLLPAAVLSRLIFVPLLMLCNVHESRLPVIFAHDAAFVVIMALFSFSNGYLATLCMVYAPR